MNIIRILVFHKLAFKFLKIHLLSRYSFFRFLFSWLFLYIYGCLYFLGFAIIGNYLTQNK